MFSLSVVEHVRLDGNLIAQNYAAHARAAERLAAAALKAKMVILSLFALATGSMVVSLFRPEREYQIAAAVIVGVAFAVHVMTLAYGIDARVHSHRLLAHRLWVMCERYRGLLAEIHDGLVDNAAVLHRQEILSEQIHAIYEQVFPLDQPAYERLRQPPLEAEGEITTDQAATA